MGAAKSQYLVARPNVNTSINTICWPGRERFVALNLLPGKYDVIGSDTRRICMPPIDRQPKLWTNAQTYTMAAICLVLGVVVGYLVHAPAQAPSSFTPNAVARAQSPATGMPTAEDLKRMADKQVAPLLEK